MAQNGMDAPQITSHSDNFIDFCSYFTASYAVYLFIITHGGFVFRYSVFFLVMKGKLLIKCIFGSQILDLNCTF